jgi:hypothetical protein
VNSFEGIFWYFAKRERERREKERKAPLSPRDKLGIKGFFHQLKFFSLPFSSTLGSRIVAGGLQHRWLGILPEGGSEASKGGH